MRGEKSPERLLRSKDVARILDLSPDDVIKLARTGRLRASKIGRRWEFRAQDVARFQGKEAPCKE